MIKAFAMALGFATFVSGTAASQPGYPSQPIRIVVGFAAGGGADILARYYGNKMQELSGNTVVIENKPGAAGNIAASTVSHARPDGHTILFAASSSMAGNRFLFKNLPFDSVKDFKPAAAFVRTTFFLVVKNDSPISSVSDLTAYLKANPGAKYAHVNTVSFVGTEMYKARAGVNAIAVGYRTAPDAVADINAGDITFMLIDSSGYGMIKNGRIKPIAVTISERLPSMPQIPTMQESGVPDYDIGVNWSAFLPAKTPDEIVAAVGSLVNRVSALPETKIFFENSAGVIRSGDSNVAAKILASDIEAWGAMVKQAGIEAK